MAYRDQLLALKNREEALVRELEETRAMMRRSLPLLESLRVASPCPEKWENMIGDDVVRFCARCAKSVYDLSAMTRDEAEEFVRSRSGPVCVTMRRRKDGKVITSDCPVGAARRRRFGIGVAALAALGAVAAGLALSRTEEDTGPCCPNAQRADHRHELDERHERAPALNQDSVMLGGLVDPPVDKKAHGRTTGCLCQPGDPLCSCL